MVHVTLVGRRTDAARALLEGEDEKGGREQ
jgi:hypothetical protein